MSQSILARFPPPVGLTEVSLEKLRAVTWCVGGEEDVNYVDKASIAVATWDHVAPFLGFAGPGVSKRDQCSDAALNISNTILGFLGHSMFYRPAF